jgi:putative flippase GtrA
LPREHVLGRALMYSVVGVIPFAANFSAFNLLLFTGVSVDDATGVAFVIGGQVSFWSHDRLTFGDRHMSLRGWRRRWVLFMPGQLLGFVLNSLSAGAMVQFTDWSTYVVYGLATVCGVIGTFTWNNLISHRAPLPTCPVDPSDEHAQQ